MKKNTNVSNHLTCFNIYTKNKRNKNNFFRNEKEN
jgi:hypothetical protein